MTTTDINYPKVKTYFINYNNETDFVHGFVLPSQCMSTGMNNTFQTTSLDELVEKLKVDFNIDYVENISVNIEPSENIDNDPGYISNEQ